MKTDDSTKKQYIEFLSKIIDNSKQHKETGSVLLKEGLLVATKTERLNLVASAQYHLFAGLEELGKYCLIKGQYPQKIETLNLTDLGFRDHSKKIEKLLQAFRPKTRAAGMPSDSDVVKQLKKYKFSTFHVDFVNGKIVSPLDSPTLTGQALNGIVDFYALLLGVVERDFEDFKEQLANE